MLRAVLGCLVAALALTQAAGASDNWLPHPADATWTYAWSDSVYAPVLTSETVTVKSVKGSAFTLGWTTDGLDNPDGAISSSGSVAFQETNAGLVNVDWSSTPPPPAFPVLCAQASGCGNALSSTLYNLIWGSRQPLLAEPLVKGVTWASTGGAANDVSSVSTYRGQERVVVPAFPNGVTAAKVETKITQAGALGDPYGSGTRTVWWVYGVGPVKLEFDHAGGSGAAVTTAALQSTSLTALATPNDADYFPLVKDSTMTFRWTNPKHLRKPEVDQFVVDAVVNGTARLKLQSATGPLQAAGSYGFSKRLDGVTNLWGTTSSTGTGKFPPLGPAGAASGHQNHFVTALDLLTFGLNPILKAYPAVGDHWATTRTGDDYRTYGVDGVTTVTGMQRVRVPAGTFTALVVRSTLKQPGFPFGPGRERAGSRRARASSSSFLHIATAASRPSSDSSSTMGGPRGLVCGLAAVLVFAGCGSSAAKNRRDAINTYFGAVQHAQVDLVGRQGQIDAALARFSLTRPSAKELMALRSGRTTVDAALAHVRGINVPPDAAQIQRLIVERLLVQRGLIDELIQTERDVDRLAAAGPRLHAAAVRLRVDLAAAAAPPASPGVSLRAGTAPSARERYALAFGRYGDALRPLVPALAPAATPSLLLPTLREQRSTLARSAAFSAAIRRDLQQADIPKANRDIHSLLLIASSLNGLATRRAEARAAKTYDTKIARIDTLEQQIARQRERLVREIG